MQKNSLENLFNPRSIAVVGASDKKGKIGTIIAQNLLELGYEGKIYFVNPTYKFLYWKKCYPELAKIEQPVDLAVIAIPAKFVLPTIEQAADKIKNFVVISAGFAEIGPEGKQLEEKLAALAKKKKLQILGPNCLGFIAPKSKLNASFAGGMPAAGKIAFISQSGALAVALLDRAKQEGLGFSKVISVGNKMQLGEAELLEYLAQDPETKVVGAYLEGIKDGAKFLQTASKVLGKKPLVVLKAGKTEQAQKAIASHTGALAGSDEIVSAALAQAGILRAENLEEFFTLLGFFAHYPAPESAECAVITNAGGAGVLITDAFKGKQLKLAELSKGAKQKLRKVLPAEAALNNPIDVLGDAQEDRYRLALEILAKEKIKNVFCLLTPQDQTPVTKVARVIEEFAAEGRIRIIPIFIGGERVDKAIGQLKKNGLVNFVTPEAAVAALDKYFSWQQNRKQIGREIFKADAARRQAAQQILQAAQQRRQKALLYLEAKELLQLYGVSSVEGVEVASEKFDLGTLEFPVVVKVDSDEVLHKTDRGGLRFGIKSQEQLAQAVKEMEQAFPGAKLLAQPQRDKFAELIVGIKRDPTFGPVIVFGLGGIYTEALKLVDYLVAPFSLEVATEKIVHSKIGFLFDNFRGQSGASAVALGEILQGVATLALENPEIAEFDINPLFLYNDGNGPLAVDLKVIF